MIGLVTITAWILLAATGTIVTAFNLWDAVVDRRSLTRRGITNGRVLIARVSIYCDATGCVAHFLLFIAGCLVAAVQFNPDPPPASLYVRSVILLSFALWVSHSFAWRWLRNRLRPKRGPGRQPVVPDPN